MTQLRDPIVGMGPLERIDNQDIQGFTSVHVLSEMSHRLMTLEAMTRFT